MFDDLNLDGRLDLLVAQNYIKWQAHKFSTLPARFFLQDQNGQFELATSAAGIENPFYAIAPLVSDFNHDGYLDLIWVNIEGSSRAFLNNGGNNKSISLSCLIVPNHLALVFLSKN